MDRAQLLSYIIKNVYFNRINYDFTYYVYRYIHCAYTQACPQWVGRDYRSSYAKMLTLPFHFFGIYKNFGTKRIGRSVEVGLEYNLFSYNPDISFTFLTYFVRILESSEGGAG